MKHIHRTTIVRHGLLLACGLAWCTPGVGVSRADETVELEQAAERKAVEAQRKQEEEQRRVQIAQQANQMEQFFRPTLQGELELVRRTCGSLAPDARKAIAAAGNEAVRAAAVEFANWQMGVRRKGNRRVDVRKTIHERVAGAVRPHATPEEFAAYEREHAARDRRRERAARTLIVMKLDVHLDLSEAQREAIARDLEAKWRPDWILELDDHGGIRIDNYPPAPDFADACIAPHLEPPQLAEWKKWSKAAAATRHLTNGHWHFDGQSLQPDRWWQP